MARDIAEVVALRAGRARLEFLPTAGGTITRYCWDVDGEVIDWLRPNAGPDGPRSDPLAMACFLMVLESVFCVIKARISSSMSINSKMPFRPR